MVTAVCMVTTQKKLTSVWLAAGVEAIWLFLSGNQMPIHASP